MVLTLALIPVMTEAAVLKEATFDVVFTSPSHCRVTASFAMEDVEVIEHRLVVREGAAPTLSGIDGSVASVGDPAASGRSLSIRLRGKAPGDQRYRLRYEVSQASAKYRCPLWLPTIPSAGRSQDVTISVSLPEGAVRAGGTLPAFSWEGERGTARVSHVPAFVRVPFGMDGAAAGAAGLDINRLMDLIAIVALALGSVVFAWRQRRR
jgi:hypothetical protein